MNLGKTPLKKVIFAPLDELDPVAEPELVEASDPAEESVSTSA